MPRIAALQQERVSAKLRFEAAWRVGDTDAEVAAQLEIERIDRDIKRELEEIERADE